MREDNITVVGTYWKTLFRNQETGAAIFEIVPNERIEGTVNSILTCQGHIGIYYPKTPIQISGCFFNGRFHVISDSLPYATKENAEQMLEYLAPSLTPQQSKAIIDVANNDLYQFFQKDNAEKILGDLLKRSKHGASTAKRILSKMQFLLDGNELEKVLLSYGVPFDRIESFRKKGVTLKQIKHNPYQYFLNARMPLRIADSFALRECHLRANSVERISGFVQYTLRNMLEAGNTCLTLSILTKVSMRRLLKLTPEQEQGQFVPFSSFLVHMAIQYASKHCSYRIVNGKNYVYENHVWEEEQIIVHHVKRLLRSKKQFRFEQVGLSQIESDLRIQYNTGQRKAFELLKNGGIKILTGPPGSGETAVIKGLIRYFEENGNGTVALAATTGMAAKVMAKACDRPSKTVNLLLNVIPFSDSVRSKDLNDPVDADLIIVDEISMIGTQLFSALVKAIRNDSILLLVGDENQLQSVEYGNVLHDLIRSNSIEVCRLTEILRQSGTICDNAALINRGCVRLSQDQSFTIYQCKNVDDVITSLRQNYQEKGAQIITPIKKTSLGTAELNSAFQAKFGKPLTVYGKKKFYKGNKVIATKTNYEKGYINGDIGHLVDKTNQDGLIVAFSDHSVVFTRSDLRDLDLAYAITIHKSQGSEFDEVHIILPAEAAHMMTRRLLYTAVTRAKKKVFIYNVGSSLEESISNTRELPRFTCLAEQIVE